MARKKRIREAKRRHEGKRHQQTFLPLFYRYMDFIASIDPQTSIMDDDGTVQFYLPASERFRRLTPYSQPIGMVFVDGSFLTVKEIFRYDYATEDDAEPSLFRLEFSYHYQIPHRGFFFRYDSHPGIGNSATHPLYHLHVGCWHAGDDKLSSLPRFGVPPVTLEDVLELIVRDFLSPRQDLEEER